VHSVMSVSIHIFCGVVSFVRVSISLRLVGLDMAIFISLYGRKGFKVFS
jgi:hypothetical protein